MVRDTDVAWNHGKALGSRLTIECNYCGRVMNGGITRFKQHLAGLRGNVASCNSVPKAVRDEILQLMQQGKAKKIQIQERRRQDIDAARADVFGPEEEDSDEETDTDLADALRASKALHEEEERRRRGFGASSSGASCSGAGGSKGGLSRLFSRRQRNRDDDVEIVGSSTRARTGPSTQIPGPTDPLAHKKESAKQPKIDKAIKGFGHFKKILGTALTKWMIVKNISPEAVQDPYFQSVIDAAASAGPGITVPSAYELGTKFFEAEYETCKSWVQTFKHFWEERGVTIMCDGWTSGTKTHLINFLIYCSSGTVFHSSVDASAHIQSANYIFSLMDKVVEDVGEKNVVQIVTDNGANFKKAGKLLMEKRPHLYWTPCAAHCIDLILEDIGKKKNVASAITKARSISRFIYDHSWTLALMKRFTNNRALIRPGITRFATHFLALDSITKHRNELIQMFSCDEWLDSRFGKMTNGPAYEVPNLMRKNKFWKKIDEILKAFEPLVKVLRMVDTDDKPTMGYIYEAMDRAKQAIREDCRYYTDYWNIIDKRWNEQLHHPLHAAGYFLNPQYYYKNGGQHSSTIEEELRVGVRDTIKRLAENMDDALEAINEIEIYRQRQQSFGDPFAIRAIDRIYPADWWINFGESAPCLRKFAIRILSQTSSSSNCERNWSTFAQIHTKARNRLTMLKLNKLVYCHYNLKLRLRGRQRKDQQDREYPDYCPINLDNIFEEDDPLLPWVCELEEPALDTDNRFQDNMQNFLHREEQIQPPRASTGGGTSTRTVDKVYQRSRSTRASELSLDSRGRGKQPIHQPEGPELQEVPSDSDKDDDDHHHSNSSSSDQSSPSGGGGGGESGDYHRDDDDTIVYETVQNFPEAEDVHPNRGYRRIRPHSSDEGTQGRVGGSPSADSGSRGGEGPGGQQAMYGYGPYGIPPYPQYDPHGGQQPMYPMAMLVPMSLSLHDPEPYPTLHEDQAAFFFPLSRPLNEEPSYGQSSYLNDENDADDSQSAPRVGWFW